MKAIPGRRAIVVFATGIDTFSKLNLEQTRTAIKAAGVPIYAIGSNTMASSPEANMAGESLKAFAADTAAGQAFVPSSPDQYPRIFSTITGALDGYEISYQRTGQGQRPGTSKITVELVNPKPTGPLRMTDQKGSEIRYQIIVTPMAQ